MKLISMTDFVLEQDEKQECSEYFDKIIVKYANFLKQPLKLEMFVPCDENGNVLEEPIWQNEYNKIKVASQNLIDKSKNYEKAKEKVLFEGFEKDFNSVIGIDGYLDTSKLKGKTIEDVIGSNLTLTSNAIKQFL